MDFLKFKIYIFSVLRKFLLPYIGQQEVSLLLHWISAWEYSCSFLHESNVVKSCAALISGVARQAQ